MNGLSRYGFALVVTGLAIAARAAVDPWFGQQLPFITFFPAIAVVVWYAGAVPAALSAAAGVLAANFLFLEPRSSFDLIGIPSLSVHAAYVIAAALIIAMGAIARQRQQRNRRYRQALEESEDRFRRMADSAPVLIWQSDTNKKGVYFNRTWLDYTGRSLEDELGDGWIESIHRDDLSALDACAQALDARRPFTTQFRLRRDDGEYRWMQDSGTPRFDRDGAFLGFVGSCTDIHELRRALAALGDSEQRFARFMAHLPGLAWIKDADGRYVFANDAARRAFGRCREDLYGHTDAEIFPPATAHLFRANDELALADETGIQTVESLTHPNGTARYSLVSKFPITVPGGPSLVGGIAVDITERRRAEHALREADRRKDAFLTILGHELRNPLAPLRTGLAVLMEANRDTRTQGVIVMMERQLMHLVRLVDDLLDVSRISRGRLELKTRPVSLGVILDAAVEQAQPAITERRHDLVVEPSDERVTVEGDADRLTQVLANLLSNAAKYMDPGGSINVSTSTADSTVIVRVRDTGYGIPRDRIETLFENFNQIPEHRSRTGGGGLGIGLALARQIVELHGGAITVASGGLDRGSEFAVSLPLAASDAAACPKVRAPGGSDAPRRILVVDDNVDAAESLRFLLEARGHSVETAYDGPEALRGIVDFEPGIVLLDIGLPGMDGYEVAERIRAMPNGPKIQLCAVTGWGQAEDKRRAFDAGFDSHVTKPMDLATLSRLVGEEQ